MALGVDYTQQLQPGIQNIEMMESVFWNSLDHDKSKVSGKGDTVVFTRSSTVPAYDSIGTGQAAAPTNAGLDAFGNQMQSYSNLQIHHGAYQEDPDAIGPEQFLNGYKIIDYASYAPMKQFRKTITQRKIWNRRVEDEELEFIEIKPLIAQFTTDQMAKVIVPMFDRYAIEKVNSYVPSENTYEVNWTSGDVFRAFLSVNDKIFNARYTEITGEERPQKGSGRKICLCTSTFLDRLTLDLSVGGAANLALAGSGIATESTYKNIVNGFEGQLKGWELVKCHVDYMPFVRDDTGTIILDTDGRPVRYQALFYDPDVIVAPLVVDRIVHDNTEVHAFSQFIKGRHIFDTWLDVDDNWIAAGNKDRDQLLARIVATDGSGVPINPVGQF